MRWLDRPRTASYNDGPLTAAPVSMFDGDMYAVGFKNTFDAGALWRTQTLSAMLVPVVTQGFSDDADAIIGWLRVVSIGATRRLPLFI